MIKDAGIRQTWFLALLKPSFLFSASERSR
jgi:hypothetical protein